MKGKHFPRKDKKKLKKLQTVQVPVQSSATKVMAVSITICIFILTVTQKYEKREKAAFFVILSMEKAVFLYINEDILVCNRKKNFKILSK